MIMLSGDPEGNINFENLYVPLDYFRNSFRFKF